jgi:hypothetical protein
MRTHLYLFVVPVLVSLFVSPGYAQKKSSDTHVYVDDKGVMRWQKSKQEIQGFGVNYTAPFAHGYKAAKKLGVDLEKAIDADVYHFARLGFDAYRVHVWDTEISDSLGNLVENEHLRLFDYLLMRLKERGIRSLITPIAFWGNGYPEPDDKTPGFARKYGKDNCLTNEDAIKAQERYLFQFLNHVNPYTKIAYKDDPDIIAFEVSNEPHHRGTAQEVTAYINRMSKAMRNTGYKKPIFYNVSHSIQLGDAYFNSDIQGGTFQWYPTGLGARHELRGNFLPNVDKYLMPFSANPKFKKSAKIVYEFDAADIGRSYIYPAMARSFREAGIQWATHFAYDPTYMAYANTEYNTHYMNLVYAPQKALSLKLASEVFHRVPMYKNYGAYPKNTNFEGFRVSYENDLAELVTDTKFIYTNNTSSAPPAPDKLEEISGFGNSPVVSYEGKGAYFINRIEPGVWRLEVMPDALWVQNIFGRNSLKKEVAVVQWHSWPMTIKLTDLGDGFSIKAINEGNNTNVDVQNASFTISPGTYLVTRKGPSSKTKPGDRWKNIRLNEFSAPASTVKKTYVLHAPASETSPANALTIDATIVAPQDPESVQLYVMAGFRPETFPMTKKDAYTYSFTIPANLVREGFLRYYIAVKSVSTTATYPAGVEGNPFQWDFVNDKAYEVPVVAAGRPLYLFNAASDSDELTRDWRRNSGIAPTGEPGKALMAVRIETLFTPDPENVNGAKTFDYSLRYNFRNKTAAKPGAMKSAKKLIVRGNSIMPQPLKIQVALITKNGATYGGIVELGTSIGDYELNLNELTEVRMVTLPRPYPTFLSYYFTPGDKIPFNIEDAETIQISVGPGLPETALQQKQEFQIESVRIE